MKLIKGNLFNTAANCLCIATNNIIKSSGEAIWGKGIALEAKKRWPDLPYLHAEFLKSRGHQFGFLKPVLLNGKQVSVFTFPTKYHWKDPSPIELIEKSSRELMDYSNQNPNLVIGLPAPGTKNGKLELDFVIKRLEPILTSDNIWIYYL